MRASGPGGKSARLHSRRRGAWAAGRVALTAVMLLALLSCATASAASPSRVQKKANRILSSALKGELAVTDTQVNLGATAVQQQLTPCLSALKGYSVPQGAARALANELGAQYLATALRPVVEVVITEDTATERLPISTKLNSALHTEVTQTAAVLKINTCADISAWQAAGFAQSAEPSGTQLANAYANTPSANADGALYRMLSAGQRKAIRPLRKKANAHAADLVTILLADVAAWAGQQGS